jgi:hypothetical protein
LKFICSNAVTLCGREHVTLSMRTSKADKCLDRILWANTINCQNTNQGLRKEEMVAWPIQALNIKTPIGFQQTNSKGQISLQGYLLQSRVFI